jgi:GMP synthase-like glutamine amidotransferase
MSVPIVLLLDGTPERMAGPWFSAALDRCGSFSFQTAVPEDDASVLAGVDVLIIGGSPRDAFAEDDWTHRAMDFTADGIDRGLPVLGVCYGHQLLGRLHGAKVARNPQGWEVGECIVQAADGDSPLGLSGELRVLESHQDCVTDPPSGCRVLATNDNSPVQAAQWGPRVYGVQFHPEFTGDILRGVWETRRDTWRGRTAFDLDARLDSASETSDGLAVLRRFLHFAS